jgi:hypothetical protein
MTHEQLVCKIYRVKDPACIPRQSLIKAVSYFFVELFHENPDHEVFAGMPESELAAFRTERINRIVERADKWKPK